MIPVAEQAFDRPGPVHHLTHLTLNMRAQRHQSLDRMYRLYLLRQSTLHSLGIIEMNKNGLAA